MMTTRVDLIVCTSCNRHFAPPRIPAGDQWTCPSCSMDESGLEFYQKIGDYPPLAEGATDGEEWPYLPPWLWILNAIFSDVLCPICGSKPFNEDGDHQDDCPTVGTCAQTAPWTPEPWHPDPSDPARIDMDAHFRAHHAMSLNYAMYDLPRYKVRGLSQGKRT